MSSLLRLKRIIQSLLMMSALGCFGTLPIARAVSPSPDGFYPGGNTAEGHDALFNDIIGTGNYNTALGAFSLYYNTTGRSNTATGRYTLYSNNGSDNTANGDLALYNNMTGNANTATGAAALYHNVTGTMNTAMGRNALRTNTSGSNNTAIGNGALYGNTNGEAETAVGAQALYSNIYGEFNTATGTQALFHNTKGDDNTANGYQALFNNREGGANTAMGYKALFKNSALFGESGSENTATGAHALESNTTGYQNTAVGFQALVNNTSGGDNTALGFGAGNGVTTANNVICIGTLGANVSESCYVANIWGKPGGTQAVYVNSKGKLGLNTSSRRFKDEIRPMGEASEAILAFQPVTFRYKQEIDSDRVSQFGLIAEEVEKINPDLVVRDGEGRPFSVRYDAVNVMLLNEFLKEHRRVQELEKQIKDLAAGLQKISAQLETSRPGSRIASNDSR